MEFLPFVALDVIFGYLRLFELRILRQLCHRFELPFRTQLRQRAVKVKRENSVNVDLIVKAFESFPEYVAFYGGALSDGCEETDSALERMTFRSDTNVTIRKNFSKRRLLRTDYCLCRMIIDVFLDNYGLRLADWHQLGQLRTDIVMEDRHFLLCRYRVADLTVAARMLAKSALQTIRKTNLRVRKENLCGIAERARMLDNLKTKKDLQIFMKELTWKTVSAETLFSSRDNVTIKAISAKTEVNCQILNLFGKRSKYRVDLCLCCVVAELVYSTFTRRVIQKRKLLDFCEETIRSGRHFLFCRYQILEGKELTRYIEQHARQLFRQCWKTYGETGKYFKYRQNFS